jgi:hypothetical protein
VIRVEKKYRGWKNTFHLSNGTVELVVLSDVGSRLLIGSTEKYGGRDRVRTCDLMLAKHALSQLSYTPILATFLF